MPIGKQSRVERQTRRKKNSKNLDRSHRIHEEKTSDVKMQLSIGFENLAMQLDQVVGNICEIYGKRVERTNFTFEDIKKNILSQKTFTENCLLDLMDYFCAEQKIKEHTLKVSHVCDALQFLRMSIDIIESQKDTNILFLAIKLVSKIVLMSFIDSMNEDVSGKYIKLLFHILKHFYKNTCIKELTSIAIDFLQVIMFAEKYSIELKPELLQLFFTVHQMYYSLYTKLLLNGIQSNPFELSDIFLLRLYSLLFISVPISWDQRFCVDTLNFINQWTKIIQKLQSLEANKIMQSIEIFVHSVQMLINNTKMAMVIKELKDIQWKLLWFCFLIDLKITAKNDILERIIHCTSSTDLLQVLQCIYGIYREQKICYNSSHENMELLLLSFVNSIDFCIEKFNDILYLLVSSDKVNTFKCAKSTRFFVTLFYSVLSNQSFHRVLSESNAKTSAYITMFNSYTANVFENINKVLAPAETESSCCTDTVTGAMSFLESEYFLFLQSLLTYIEKYHEVDVTFHNILNSLYKVSLTFYNTKKYLLAHAGFQFCCDVLIFSSELINEDMKQICGKYNMVTKCWVKLGDSVKAYESSKDLIKVFHKYDKINLCQNPLLLMQIQNCIRLKLEILKCDGKRRFEKLLYDELFGVIDCEDEFWLIVLKEEYKSYKKLSTIKIGNVILVRIIQLQRDIYERIGDLLNYSLMMLELSMLQRCDPAKRYYWCMEARSVLEEMHKNVSGNSDALEWHVKDVLAVTYFQLSVLQYEESIGVTNYDIDATTNEIANSIAKNLHSNILTENGNTNQMEEGFFEQSFMSNLNTGVELWLELYQKASSSNNFQSIFRDARLAAECLYNSAILYSLMNQNILALQTSYLSGMIYQMLSKNPDFDCIDKQISSWILTTTQMININDFTKAEALLKKTDALIRDVKFYSLQIEILHSALLLNGGEIQNVIKKLTILLGDPLLDKPTKTALTIKSDIYQWISCIKLMPDAREDGLNICGDTQYPFKSPFPPIADQLKCLRSLYDLCTNGEPKEGENQPFSFEWYILDKLLHCLSNYADLLTQQGSVLEAKSFLKEALLLVKKYHLSLRTVDIIQKITAIDLILHKESSFKENFLSMSSILKPSDQHDFENELMYLPEFIQHDSKCSCFYCLCPKLQEVYVRFYLQHFESKKKFESSCNQSSFSIKNLVDILMLNAENRFQQALANVADIMSITTDFTENKEHFEKTTKTNKSIRRRVKTKKKPAISLASNSFDNNHTTNWMLSKYDVETKIYQLTQNYNDSVLKCVETLIHKVEISSSLYLSKREYYRLKAQLYCLRTIIGLKVEDFHKNFEDKCSVVANEDKIKKRTRRKRGEKKQVEAAENIVETISFNKDILTDLQKALSMLNPFTDTLIIKAVYQLISFVSVISDDVWLTSSSQLLSSARILHQQVLTSSGKKIQKHNRNNKANNSLSSTCDILQKYSDPQIVFKNEDVQELIDQYIPEGWRVCSISLTQVGKRNSLLITRVQPNNSPVVINIDLQNKDQISSANLVCDFASAFNDDFISVFQRVMDDNLESMKLKNKTSWLDERIRLDEKLKSLVMQIEHSWLFGWKGVLLGCYQDEQIKTASLEVIENICTELNDTLGIKVNRGFITVLVEGYSRCSQKELLVAIKAFSHNEYEVLKVIEKNIQASIIGSTNKCRRNARMGMKSHMEERLPVILVLDEKLQGLPWEVLPALKNEQFCRMPSLLLTVTHCIIHQQLLTDGVSTESIYYMVNPRNDLRRTEEMFAEWFRSEGWQGIVGKSPTQTEFTQALTDNDIFIYCGHGSGQEYLGWDLIQKLDCRAVSLLMGCSSGKLTVRGSLEPHGMAQYYLMAGCPAVVGNLWDVTDKDIDLFLKDLIKLWIQNPSETVNISAAVQKSRSACKLEYLIGAAPVLYGLPLHVIRGGSAKTKT